MDVDAQLLKERAQGFQDRGEFETALPLMLASVQKRENSHTLCLSLSALGFLYIDMLKFKDAEHVAQRMLAEAHRYDTRNQKRIAKEILKEAVKENNFGFVHLTVPSKLTCSAITLNALPPLIFPKVITTGSKGSNFLVINS